MKTSIALTLLILALGLPLGWRNRQQLMKARERHAQLVAEAARSGGIHHDSTSRKKAERITKGEHESKQQIAMKIAADLIAARKNGNGNEITQDASLDSLAAVAAMDADQLNFLFPEILASKELTDEARQSLLFSLAEVASDHPQAVLTLVIKSPDLLKIVGLGKILVSSALVKWAKDDPQAALAWVRLNQEIFSKSTDQEGRLRFISSAAEKHPALALRLVNDLGLEPTDQTSALSGICSAPQTAEDRTNTLAAINTYLASLPAGKQREGMSEQLITEIMNDAAQDGFDAGSKWLDQAGFTPEQLKSMFDRNLVWVTEVGEAGKWVEWMGKTNTGEGTNPWIKELVRHWAQEDYLAAGKWLESTPEGPTKNTSISAFAEALSHHHPATAEQWALSLPLGQERADTLKTIYTKWPQDDQAARHAFGKKHGFE